MGKGVLPFDFAAEEIRYRRLVESIVGYAIFLLDPDGNVRTWNSGAESLKGYAEREIVGRSFEMFYGEEDRQASIPERALETARRDGRFEAEGWRYRKDGTRFWALVVIDPITDDVGNLVGFAKITRDVTNRLEAQKALEAAAEALHQAQKLQAIGQLTGGVAHDFNNLLTVILGSAVELTESLSHDQQLRVLAEMTVTAAERAAELTGRLLAFARRQALEPKVVDLNKLIASFDPLLRRTLNEDIELELVRAGGLWLALIDAGQLENAILNLAINARDAMPGGGRLTIETANVSLDDRYAREHSEVSPGQYVMVSVSDTGGGMSPDTLRRAFEPFFTTKQIGLGSGLGLSMVFGFVKQSSGHVKIYSELGHGTTVKLYLPRAPASGEAALQPLAPAEAIGGYESILLVEDSDLVRAYIATTLEELGYRVVSAASGPEALVALENAGPFDLLFTDVVMPGGMNGRQLADAVRALNPGMPVLFTSGYTENAIIHHGRLDRGVHLLNKPFRKEDLATKVRLVLKDAAVPQPPA